MDADRMLTDLRAWVDPRYRPPSGEWIRSTRPTSVALGGPASPTATVPKGTVMRVARWEGDGLLLKHHGTPPMGDDYILLFIAGWPHLDWEVIEDAEDAEQGRRP